jgi:hypothetical protein
MPHRDPEARKEYMRQYHLKNRERKCQMSRDYHAAHKAQIAARDKEYREANKPRLAEAAKAYREANREKVRAAKRRLAGMVSPPGELIDGPCHICGRVVSPLHCDHNHATGAVRGWLCNSCNNGLGRFKDSPAKLRAAAAYLEAHGSCSD